MDPLVVVAKIVVLCLRRQRCQDGSQLHAKEVQLQDA